VDNYKDILINLIQKYYDTLNSGHEYIVCQRLAKKIDDAIIDDNPNSVKIDFNKISSITKEEMEMFSLPDSERIIRSIIQIQKMSGFRLGSILKNINKLKEDLINNKLKTFVVQKKSLDTLLKIVSEDEYKEGYKLILDFINMSVDNKLLDITTAINLNFYILYKVNGEDLTQEVESDVVELIENVGTIIDIRKELEQIFEKYGYVYDRKALARCGGEEDFVKYAKIEYVDYVLSKFKRYAVTQEELYAKKSFYNIVIDNDKESFNSVLDFIDHNDCSLNKLLYFPSVFSKRSREYVMKNKKKAVTSTGEKTLKICGCNDDFLKNIKLYKALKGIDIINDNDLENLGKFLSTPHSLVKKNLNLLLKYGILSSNKVPDSMVSLCGKRTEYLIDRFIESSLYEQYLLPRVDENGEVKSSRGTSWLYFANNPLMFYKIKRADDVGEPIFHSNAGLRRVLTDDNKEYLGIRLDENCQVVQEQMSMDMIDQIDPRIKKWLPGKFYSKNNNSWDDVAKLEFNNLYKYRTFLPTDIFVNDNIKGNLYKKIFELDFKDIINGDDVLEDGFIKMLDNAIYCDAYGRDKPVKTSEFQYEFSHPSFPNMHVVISRYKVLRLCKLLKDNNAWINYESSSVERENALLSIIVKDTIISEYEMVMLRMAIRSIMTNGLIRVDDAVNYNTKKRGAR